MVITNDINKQNIVIIDQSHIGHFSHPYGVFCKTHTLHVDISPIWAHIQ